MTFELFRKGLRRSTVKYKGNFLMQHIGGGYIWHKDPDDQRAIDIVYHASFSPEYRYYAVYSGLSVANPKSEKVLKRLVDLAMEYHQLGRILWGVKQSKQEVQFVAFLEPYLQASDMENRERADIVAKALRGEIDAGKWEREWDQMQKTERTIHEFGDELPKIKKTFLSGTSEDRLKAINFIRRNAITLTFDQSFIRALDACSQDSDANVRAGAANFLGYNYIWGKDVEPKEVIEILLRLSNDEDRQVRYNSVYSGLSVVNEKDAKVIKRLVELALTDHENNLYGRIVWGLRGPMRFDRKLVERILAEQLDEVKSDLHKAASLYFLYKELFDTEPPSAWDLEDAAGYYPNEVFGINFSPQEPFRPENKDALWEEFYTNLPENIDAQRFPVDDSRELMIWVKVQGQDDCDKVTKMIENNPRLQAGQVVPLGPRMQLYFEELRRIKPSPNSNFNNQSKGPSKDKPDVNIEVAESGGDSEHGGGNIVVISKGKSTMYSSIQEAIDAAPAGSVVRIGPGVYEERLGIDKPLTLEGAGWDKTTIVTENNVADVFEEAMLTAQKRIYEAKSEEQRKKLAAEFRAQFEGEMKDKMAAQTHLVSDTENVVIRNLKLTSPGRHIDGKVLSVPVIKFSNARVLVSGCAVVGTPGNGINIEDGSDVEIRDSLVAGVWSTGIAVTAGRGDVPKARIINCDVRNCHHRGITIGPGCDSTVVEGCRISGSSWHGIRYDNASPRIVGNLIFANVRFGIYASGETAADVRQNLFYGNEMTGISCWFKNRDTIEANTFVGNKQSGLDMLGASRPIVRKNIFYANPTAVFCGDIGGDSTSAISDGTVNLEENLFWGFEHKVVWRHAGDVEDEIVTEEVELDEQTRNVVFDPEFKDITAEDYSLKLDSPARRPGIGAADLIDSESPWPIQDEEIAIIPDGETEDTSWMGRVSSTGKMERPIVLVENRGGVKPQESIKGKPKKQEGSDHPGRISGVVINSDTGDPIVGAYVGVGDFGDSGGSNYSRHRSQGFHDKTKTDAEGRFELGGLVFTDKHRYLKYHPLVVTHPDFVRRDRKIELPSDGPAPDVKVNLMPAAKIDMTIVDADGNPLPGQWLIRLEALDGRRFIPPGSDPHLSSFASNIWAQMPDLRARMGVSNGFTFTELDAGEYSIEAIRFHLVDKPTPQNIWNPVLTYHGSIPNVRVQAGQAKQVRLSPQDHQTRLTITHPEYPDKLMDKLERSSQMPLICLISRSPGALLWDDGKIHHLEDQRLGRIDQKRFFRAFFLQGKPLTINNLPPDSYSLFAMSVYGQVAGCLIGARAELAKGDDITVEIPWRQPTGPSMVGPNRSFDYPVNLEAREYSVSKLCEILTEITQSNPRIIADPSIENQKLRFGRGEMSIWDVLEMLYLDKGWRLDEGQDKTLIIRAVDKTNVPVEGEGVGEKVSQFIGADLPDAVQNVKFLSGSFGMADKTWIRFDVPLPDLKSLLAKSDKLPDFPDLHKNPKIQKDMDEVYKVFNIEWWKSDELESPVSSSWINSSRIKGAPKGWIVNILNICCSQVENNLMRVYISLYLHAHDVPFINPDMEREIEDPEVWSQELAGDVFGALRANDNSKLKALIVDQGQFSELQEYKRDYDFSGLKKMVHYQKADRCYVIVSPIRQKEVKDSNREIQISFQLEQNAWRAHSIETTGIGAVDDFLKEEGFNVFSELEITRELPDTTSSSSANNPTLQVELLAEKQAEVSLI
jgi:nitrous oxidase accessory protein NosD